MGGNRFTTNLIRFAVFELMLAARGYDDSAPDSALEQIERLSDSLFDAWLNEKATEVLNIFFEEMENLHWSTDVNDVATARRATLSKVTNTDD